jgi:hypothetical protein
MKEKPLKSDQINELAKALCKAQGKIKHAVKDSANPFFKSRYADLTSVWDAIRDAFQAEGLSVAQCPQVLESGAAVLETTLMHSSGQWISSRVPLNPVKNDPQGVGSAITYARRYALQSIAGVCADDDDGEAAQGRKKVNSAGESVQKKPSWTDAQKLKAGEIKSKLMTFGDGGTEAADTIWKNHQYDDPETVIKLLADELALWKKEA